MNTHQLYRILETMINDSSYHFDVIAADRLFEVYHTYKARPLALIVNTDPEGLPGSHWIAIFRQKHGRLQIFDSYGEPIATYSNHFKFLTLLNAVENCKSIQSMTSNSCGLYCLYFLQFRILGCTFSFVIDCFGCNKSRNEKRIKSWFKATISSSNIVRCSLDNPSQRCKSRLRNCK